MNHLGLAREMAVLYGRPLKRPGRPAVRGRREGRGRGPGASIEDFEACPRFVARVVRGVEDRPQPGSGCSDRLEAIGLRPINNVVDVTNFILWELGQPLHAYDLAKLAGRRPSWCAGRGRASA